MRTSPLDGDPGFGRPSIWFRSPRRTLDGWGVAEVIEVPAPWAEHLAVVTERLAALAEVDGATAGTDPTGAGTGPVAFAALPFDRAEPARFVVPAVLVGSSGDGERWITTGGAMELPTATAVPAPTSVSITESTTADAWCASVETATKRIASGELVKVVLSRRLDVVADVDFDPASVGETLAAAHPHALRWCIDGFVGASPELLVSRVGSTVRAQPMAGTTPRSGDAAADQRLAGELLASHKNREEHQITIDAVHDALIGWCSYLDAEPTPSVVAAGSVQHLATLVEGRLSRPAASVLELVAALHPTPAVGGWPREPALSLIAELEPGGRGRYAGPVGWVDAVGNGAWAVGIRSVEIDGPRARVHAGVGVVADSDPVAELEETRAKFAATMGSLTRL